MAKAKKRDGIRMNPICPRCGGRHGVEVSGDGYEWDCASCGGHLICAIGPDGGEMYPYHREDGSCGCASEPHTCDDFDESDADRAELVVRAERAEAERDRLLALINTPRTDDFFEAVRIESAHQIERWGTEHDAGKRPEDWIALAVYLLGKATRAHYEGDRDKLLHHVITVAAVCLNWHRNATGVSTAMRPDAGLIDARSPAADALLDYREPPTTPRADRLAKLEALLPTPEEREALAKVVQSRIVKVVSVGCSMCHDSTWDHECDDEQREIPESKTAIAYLDRLLGGGFS